MRAEAITYEIQFFFGLKMLLFSIKSVSETNTLNNYNEKNYKEINFIHVTDILYKIYFFC